MATTSFLSLVDPGFPGGEGANSKGGCEKLFCQFFPRKLHEIERIWTARGAHIPDAPLDPPMTFVIFIFITVTHKTSSVENAT